MPSPWVSALSRLRRALQQGRTSNELERQYGVLAEYLVDAFQAHPRSELRAAAEAMRLIRELFMPSSRASRRPLAYWAGRINGHFDVAVVLLARQLPDGFTKAVADPECRAVLRLLGTRESTRERLLAKWQAGETVLDRRLKELVSVGVVTVRGAGSDVRFGLTKAARADAVVTARSLGEILDDLRRGPHKLTVVAVVAAEVRNPPTLVCEQMVHHLQQGVRYYVAVSEKAEDRLRERIDRALQEHRLGGRAVTVKPLRHPWGLEAMVILKFDNKVTIAYAAPTPSLNGTDDLLAPMTSERACTLAHLAFGGNKDLQPEDSTFEDADEYRERIASAHEPRAVNA